MILCIVIFLFGCLFTDVHVYAASDNYIDLPIEEDTYVEENYPAIAPWNNRNWYVGTDSYYGKGKTRTLVHVNFSLLENANIKVTDISEVNLNAYTYLYEGAASVVTVDAYTTTSPWNMYDVTWQSQPTISSKKDSTMFDTVEGKKELTLTNAFKDAFSSTSLKKGFLLKMNPETGKSLIFWAHGCDLAPSPPTCAAGQKPYIRVYYQKNTLPTTCSLKLPNVSISNNSTLELQANPSIDKEGEIVTYVGRVCQAVDCSSTAWQGNISATAKTTVLLPDGVYFLSCNALDTHNVDNWGSTNQLEIDTIPPQTPELIAEPEFTGTLSNTVSWQQAADCAEYQLLSSERSSFSSYNTYSAWVQQTSFTVTHTKEKTFYYKVRCRDKALNESLWSTSTSTTIDTTFPTVYYFKANKQILSPKKLNNGEIDGTSYIQGSITDQTIAELKIVITDHKGKVVFSRSETEKQYIWLHWPERIDYQDDIYTVNLFGYDSLGRVVESDPIFLTIDTTPPSLPIIKGLENNKIYGSKKLLFYTACTTDSTATVYLSNKIIAKGTYHYTITLNENDGVRQLKINCTDNAGNSSERKLTFTIDTTPPNLPELTVTYEDKKITLKSYCREQGYIQFFSKGILLKESNCTKGAYAQHIFEVNTPTVSIFTFNARLADIIYNWSELTEKSIFVDTENKAASKKFTSKCVLTYNIDNEEVSGGSCTTPDQSLLSYANTSTLDTGKFVSLFKINDYSKVATVELTLVGCKSKSIWDPRTWSSCVTEKIAQESVMGAYIPTFESNVSLQNLSSGELAAEHTKVSTLQLTESAFITVSTDISTGKSLLYTISTPKKQFPINLIYEQQNSAGYLQKLFTKTVAVSQWHGNTAYQKPHAGIDFSIYKETINSPADGTIVSAAYNKTNSCNAGGYYIGIQHPNGLYTYYFHLQNLKNKTANWKVGDKIKKGTFLAISGNTGMFNCEALGYHLHFEVRTGKTPQTHKNPVPYLAMNWSEIRTANAQQYPGRLTGDNPHPKY